MGVIYQLFLAVFMNTATGSLIFLLWAIMKKWLMKVNPDLIYPLLRFVCAMYVFPIGYLIMQRVYQGGIRQPNGFMRIVFATTDVLAKAVIIFSIIWAGIVAVLLIYRFVSYIRFQFLRRGNVPETEAGAEEMLGQICKKMNIPQGKIAIYRNDTVETPMIVCLRHPEILLPYGKEYTEQEMEILMSHELSHYKHKDLWMKIFCVYIIIIHCFNPMAYFLLKQVNKWSECMADVTATDCIGGIRDYFHYILDLIPIEGGGFFNPLYTALGRSGKEIKGRVDFMKQYRETKKRGEKGTAAIVAIFVIVTGIVSFWAGVEITKIHNRVYQNTEEQAQEKADLAVDGVTEYNMDLKEFQDKNKKIICDGNEIEDDIEQFRWEIEPDAVYVTNTFKVVKDVPICVLVFLSSYSGNYQMGIIDKNKGQVRYVDAQEVAIHKFAVDTTGKYALFVKNCSDQKILFRGGVSFSDL